MLFWQPRTSTRTRVTITHAILRRYASVAISPTTGRHIDANGGRRYSTAVPWVTCSRDFGTGNGQHPGREGRTE